MMKELNGRGVVDNLDQKMTRNKRGQEGEGKEGLR
jgi:hypothetical protein